MSAEPDRRRLRASDADRAATAERLRAAVDEGRLDLTEYDARVLAAYAATTYGDLEPLTADLPAVPDAAPAGPARRRRVDEWRDWVGAAVVLVAIWGGTSLLAGDLTPFWPLIPLGIWAAVLVAGALRKKQEDT